MQHFRGLRKGWQRDFCGAVNCRNRLCCGRALGCRTRLGGRREPEQARAVWGQPSSECPGVLVVPRRPPRQARRLTSAHSGFRVVQSAFGRSHVAMRKARHRSQLGVVSKNKALRERAFREILWRIPHKRPKKNISIKKT